MKGSCTDRVRVAAVIGPTAAGKSRLAIALAKELHGEVISCDSMQIYRGMDVGTGKVLPEQRQGVPHHLIDIAPVSASFSLSDYAALARETIADVAKRGALPVLCGGTGLYLDRLLDGTTLSDAPGDPDVRRLLEQKDGDELYEELLREDPESAAIIHKNNRKRVIRALEILRATGLPKSEWDRRSKAQDPPYDARRILLLPAEGCRQALYDAIDRRVDEMFRQGLEQEARALWSAHPSPTAAQAIGYKEFAGYFEGRESLQSVREKIRQASRNYAKRQLTWFSRKKDESLCLDFQAPPEELLRKAIEYIEK